MGSENYVDDSAYESSESEITILLLVHGYFFPLNIFFSSEFFETISSTTQLPKTIRYSSYRAFLSVNLLLFQADLMVILICRVTLLCPFIVGNGRGHWLCNMRTVTLNHVFPPAPSQTHKQLYNLSAICICLTDM